MVTATQIEQRPASRRRSRRAVPGVVISQHSGEGKANQYYLRGFNLDHGTDLATSVAGVPVNMPTHAHGQGYSDNNFLIPELVSGVQYQKGTYFAEEGDFSAAGADQRQLPRTSLDQPIVKLEGGEDGYRPRALRRLARGSEAATCSTRVELYHNDGPWVRPRRLPQGQRRPALQPGRPGRTASASPRMGYTGDWNSTDQVPRARRDERRSSTASARSTRRTAARPTATACPASGASAASAGSRPRSKAYVIDYGLDLFSNFTYFLDDPVHGDQFEQQDDRACHRRREGSQRLVATGSAHDVESTAGLQVRNDHIPTVGLYHTKARDSVWRRSVRTTSTSRAGRLYVQTSIQWSPKVRTVAGPARRPLPLRRRRATTARTRARATAIAREPEAQRSSSARGREHRGLR